MPDQEIVTNLNKAHWFTEDLVSESVHIAPAAEELLNKLYEHSKPVRKQTNKHLPQLEILILNLIKASEHSEKVMAVPMSSGAYSEMHHLTFRVLAKHHLKTLIAMKWLNFHKGFSYSKSARISKVTLNKPLLKWLHHLTIKPNLTIHRKPPSVPLVLKDSEKKVISMPDSLKQQAQVFIDQTNKINSLLEKTFIDLFLDEYELEELEEVMTDKALEDSNYHFEVDLSARYLKRIFNNSSLEEGGRFYNVWWQSIPSRYRPFISINGDFTIEMDYSSIHIHLLYAVIQQTCPLKDHYVFGKLNKEFRETTKTLMMMLINASSEAKALNAARRDGLFDEGFPEGIENPKEYLKEIYKYHEPIQSYFGTGYGVKLQYQDAQIAASVMERMLPEPCLPVHDSFIVRVEKAKKLKRIMNEEFQAFTGVKANIKETIITLSKERQEVVNQLIDDELSGYSSRLHTWRLNHQYRYFTEGGSSTDKPLLNL